ncbi:methyltransferase domain-containing protein [Paralimibaculum aggregatum]|uniref:Methyltransferase domain-containing protein n=1 Tax=Paralimibaculum aggregatum TaxID=3036245 RepID=A0ABQ6LMA6_9RHOB|nr:methyltransferase domain-containing protein [Limibaculum sp. NKW23]GMG82363.1 methyltransferase domain-containing protein [Limibaculum sp. NKW23]
MGDTRPEIFETAALGRRRDRAMACGFADGADFLWRIAADGIAERLADTPRGFPRAVLLGTGAGAVAAALPAKAGSERLLQLDPSAAMARAAGPGALVDPCETLPLEPAAADLALSVLLMHWQNDPVGHLVQLRRALAPDGLAIAVLFGGQSLAGLRAAFASAEAEILGGITPRVAPMAELRDLGALMQRAGFAMPVADRETLTASYADPLALMRELRAMGETNILKGRARGLLRRDVLARAAELYAAHWGTAEGRVEAVFELVFLTGWAPGPGQPEALRPGSATTRLADVLGTVEIPSGEKPPGEAGGR